MLGLVDSDEINVLMQILPQVVWNWEVLSAVAEHYTFLFFVREGGANNLLLSTLETFFTSYEKVIDVLKVIENLEFFVTSGYSFENLNAEEKRQYGNFFIKLYISTVQLAELNGPISEIYEFRNKIGSLYACFYKILSKIDQLLFFNTAEEILENISLEANKGLLEAFIHSFGCIFENFVHNTSMSPLYKKLIDQLVVLITKIPSKFIEERFLDLLAKTVKILVNQDIESILVYIINQIAEDNNKNERIIEILRVLSRFEKSVELYVFINESIDKVKTVMHVKTYWDLKVSLVNLISSLRDYTILDQAINPLVAGIIENFGDSYDEFKVRSGWLNELVGKLKIHKNSQFYIDLVSKIIAFLLPLAVKQLYAYSFDLLCSNIINVFYELLLNLPDKSTFPSDLWSFGVLCATMNMNLTVAFDLLAETVNKANNIDGILESFEDFHSRISNVQLSLLGQIKYTHLLQSLFFAVKSQSIFETILNLIMNQVGQLTGLTDFETIKGIVKNVGFLNDKLNLLHDEHLLYLVENVVANVVNFNEVSVALAAKFIENTWKTRIDMLLLGFERGLQKEWYKLQNESIKSVLKSLSREDIGFLVIKAIMKDIKAIGNGENSSDCLIAYELRKQINDNC